MPNHKQPKPGDIIFTTDHSYLCTTPQHLLETYGIEVGILCKGTILGYRPNDNTTRGVSYATWDATGGSLDFHRPGIYRIVQARCNALRLRPGPLNKSVLLKTLQGMPEDLVIDADGYLTFASGHGAGL